ncbi:MAG: carboxypeptidase-like regulatory domain-containing protein [Planctomycetes bacterium]|nr:carboxypeptidase-like regulatory domain-containing protein [Planctomycetota bacterium]
MRAACLLLLVACRNATHDSPSATTAVAPGTHVRFVDGSNGKPINGVSVELWSEDLSEPLRVATLLGKVASNREGDASVPLFVDGVRVEKLRVSKSGYASTESGGAPEEGPWFLHAAMPRSFRVLDLEGRPIAGATVRTRQSCEHAVPAVEGRTGADGRVRLDDFPSLGDGAELEVVADGFGTLSHEVLDDSALAPRAALFGEPIELRLARRPGYRLELVDAHGAPMVHRRVTAVDGPSVSAWTDARGEVLYPAPGFDRGGGFELADVAGREALGAFEPPTLGSIRVSPQNSVAPPDEVTAQVHVVVTGIAPGREPPYGPPRVELWDARGRTTELAFDVRAPLGKTRAVIGHNFSGWCEHSEDFELGPDGHEVALDARREGELHITLPARSHFLHLQAGDDSITRADLYDDEALELFTPPDVPVTLWLEDADGSAYSTTLSPLASGETRSVALADACVRRAPSLDSLPMCRTRFEVPRELGAVHASFRRALGGESETDNPNGYELELFEGEAYRARFSTDAGVFRDFSDTASSTIPIRSLQLERR